MATLKRGLDSSCDPCFFLIANGPVTCFAPCGPRTTLCCDCEALDLSLAARGSATIGPFPCQGSQQQKDVPHKHLTVAAKITPVVNRNS